MTLAVEDNSMITYNIGSGDGLLDLDFLLCKTGPGDGDRDLDLDLDRDLDFDRDLELL